MLHHLPLTLFFQNTIHANIIFSEKTSLLAKNFKVWKGDVFLLCKLLLCKNDLRKYNIREKTTVKILSRHFNAPYQGMISFILFYSFFFVFF